MPTYPSVRIILPPTNVIHTTIVISNVIYTTFPKPVKPYGTHFS